MGTSACAGGRNGFSTYPPGTIKGASIAWPGISRTLKALRASCLTCASAKSARTALTASSCPSGAAWGKVPSAASLTSGRGSDRQAITALIACSSPFAATALRAFRASIRSPLCVSVTQAHTAANTRGSPDGASLDKLLRAANLASIFPCFRRQHAVAMMRCPSSGTRRNRVNIASCFTRLSLSSCARATASMVPWLPRGAMWLSTWSAAIRTSTRLCRSWPQMASKTGSPLSGASSASASMAWLITEGSLSAKHCSTAATARQQPTGATSVKA
mmetsp:Transcript_61024/g.157357  ORF Transcript_61024/g.157357 Transcript_61024/m.157357 type:complete len:274 (-) Transcript_61024:169-990(-)